MNIKEIKELIDIVDKSNLTGFEYEQSGIKLVLSKQVNVVNTISATPAMPVSSSISQPAISVDMVEAQVSNTETNVDKNLMDIKSPIVGTYYESSSPDSKPFVSVGDKVKKGQVLCIVEAMKLMNEITAEIDCEIVKILLKNEAVVEYGQPLFQVRGV